MFINSVQGEKANNAICINIVKHLRVDENTQNSPQLLNRPTLSKIKVQTTIKPVFAGMTLRL